jgi:hypothetical protein
VQNRQIPQRPLPQSQRPKLPLPKPNRPRIKARMTDTVLAEVILRHRLFWPNFPNIMNMQETPVSRFIKG